VGVDDQEKEGSLGKWSFDTLCGRWLLRMRGFELFYWWTTSILSIRGHIAWKHAISVRFVSNATKNQQNGKHVTVVSILRIRENRL
jgi:hypothetical protein